MVQHLDVAWYCMQAQQLAEKSQRLGAQDAALQRDLQILAGENAQLASAQLAVQTAAASNKQLSDDLAEERDSLAKQLRSLNARESDIETRLEDCDRTVQVNTSCHVESRLSGCLELRMHTTCFAHNTLLLSVIL